MFRATVVATIFLWVAHGAYAGPFGLEQGTPASSLKVQEGEVVVPGTGFVFTPPKPNAKFKLYLAWTSPVEGLYMVRAVQTLEDVSRFGDQIRREFESLKSTLSRLYGEPKSYDFLRDGSIWDEPRDWMTALEKRERSLAAYWVRPETDGLPADIRAISIEAVATSSSEGGIILSYEFSNFDAAEADAELSQDDTL